MRKLIWLINLTGKVGGRWYVGGNYEGACNIYIDSPVAALYLLGWNIKDINSNSVHLGINLDYFLGLY